MLERCLALQLLPRCRILNAIELLLLKLIFYVFSTVPTDHVKLAAQGNRWLATAHCTV